MVSSHAAHDFVVGALAGKPTLASLGQAALLSFRNEVGTLYKEEYCFPNIRSV